MNKKINNAALAKIFDKLQTPTTTLETFSNGRMLQKKYIEMALEDLREAVKLLKLLQEG